jgi:hypothetical protein
MEEAALLSRLPQTLEASITSLSQRGVSNPNVLGQGDDFVEDRQLIGREIYTKMAD